MTDYRDFFNEVIHTLLDIEQWFAGTAEPALLTRLLGRFSPEFSMVAPDGSALDCEALRGLFEQLGGTRPGLRISLSDLRGLARHPGGVTLSYRELQSDASGPLSDRRATAVIEQLPGGALRWRHLHETFC